MKTEWWCEDGKIIKAMRNGYVASYVMNATMLYFAKFPRVIMAGIVSHIETELYFMAGSENAAWFDLEAYIGPFHKCPDNEAVSELVWDIFYPKGLFAISRPKRWVVLHGDVRGKHLKFTPKPNKGPRDRWGKS